MRTPRERSAAVGLGPRATTMARESRAVKRALRPSGFATFQTGVPFYQPLEITDALKELRAFFPQSGLYLTVVPSYIGGFMALSWASKGGKPLSSAQLPAMRVLASARRSETLRTSARVSCSCAPRLILSSAPGWNSASSASVCDSTVAWRASPPAI